MQIMVVRMRMGCFLKARRMREGFNGRRGRCFGKWWSSISSNWALVFLGVDMLVCGGVCVRLWWWKYARAGVEGPAEVMFALVRVALR